MYCDSWNGLGRLSLRIIALGSSNNDVGMFSGYVVPWVLDVGILDII